MLPITLATVDNFCCSCLQELPLPQQTDNKKKEPPPQHDLKKQPQLLRAWQALTDQLQPTTNRSCNSCNSCFTKLKIFCSFGELANCTAIALRELIDENEELTRESKFGLICVTCFRNMSNTQVGQELSQTVELKNLWQLMTGIDLEREEDKYKHRLPKHMCKYCSQKFKTFVDLQKLGRESQKDIKSIIYEAEDGAEEKESTETFSNPVFKVEHQEEILEQASICSSPLEFKDETELVSAYSSDAEITKSPSVDPFEPTESQISTSNHWPCTICHKEYPSKTHLQRHLSRVHTQAQHKCSYCQREFKRKHHLTDHIKLVHKRLKPFKCDLCQRSFGLPRTLRIHMMGHSNERPFRCDICQKTFRQKNELNVHLTNHSSDSRFRCTICSRGQASQADLEAHLLRHTNTEGYQCTKCGRKFTKLCHLKQHDNAVHLKLRPFKCDQCEHSFAARKTLQIHERTHSSEYPIRCDICLKNFRTRGNFQRHMRTHQLAEKEEKEFFKGQVEQG